MRGKTGDKIRLQHILDAIDEIENYLQDVDYAQFAQNSMMRFACLKQLEIVGEACNHLTTEIMERYQDVEWAQIIGMRNVFIHEYFGVDLNLVWDIIQTDLPDLKMKIQAINSEML